MRTAFLRWFGAISAAAVLAFSNVPAHAAPKKDFKIAWSIYAGWMPWGYAADSGIIKKWADKYGIKVEITQVNDYVESINQYTAGAFDGCVMTNMDALTIPAVGGVDTTALIARRLLERQRRHRAQEGQDGRRTSRAGRSTWSSCRCRTTCWRARSTASGLREKDVKVVNTSDADIVSVFTSTKDVTPRSSPGTRSCAR